MASRTEEKTEQSKRFSDLSPNEFRREIADDGTVLLDTREQHEYDEAHIDRAELVPPSEVTARIDELAPDTGKRVVLYCRSGNRSARAAEELADLGYTNLAHLTGGILAWQEQGLPVVEAEGMTAEQRMRYSRHTLLPEVGVEGQLKLLHSKVLLIGAGGLGSPTALYLAAAGVGTMGIVDFDTVDLSNLHRQIIHGHANIGRPKVDSARDQLADINPDVNVVAHTEALTSENALEILGQYDIIVNGCDNFATRYLVNDAAYLLKKPLVDGSIFRFEGQATVFMPGEGCYRCLFPAPPPPGAVPSCAEAGVLGVLPGMIGVIQAMEAIKLILNLGEP